MGIQFPVAQLQDYADRDQEKKWLLFLTLSVMQLKRPIPGTELTSAPESMQAPATASDFLLMKFIYQIGL